MVKNIYSIQRYCVALENKIKNGYAKTVSKMISLSRLEIL
jgi:hypothetical protein